eukprot:CAMPEP_0183381678 /NCGR_PEP_ID=MMETSP0164_2-20130417/126559_1 /TAXON_ID=221442 /ORGANISM="Coccolithus pelagicus ssp braarudi, Strain PLY182g" /LENGTH=94 /DNA_ID=CAMNT_0025559287 /DNA_START=284 /DNA_END=568 /DNA_ORIENTATION=+
MEHLTQNCSSIFRQDALSLREVLRTKFATRIARGAVQHALGRTLPKKFLAVQSPPKLGSEDDHDACRDAPHEKDAHEIVQVHAICTQPVACADA